MQEVIEYLDQSIEALNLAIAKVPQSREVLTFHLKHLRGLLAAQSRFIKAEQCKSTSARTPALQGSSFEVSD